MYQLHALIERLATAIVAAILLSFVIPSWLATARNTPSKSAAATRRAQWRRTPLESATGALLAGTHHRRYA
jgi:hypothetical protein